MYPAKSIRGVGTAQMGERDREIVGAADSTGVYCSVIHDVECAGCDAMAPLLQSGFAPVFFVENQCGFLLGLLSRKLTRHDTPPLCTRLHPECIRKKGEKKENNVWNINGKNDTCAR